MLGDSLVEWGDWQKHLPAVKVINRGFAGEPTEGLAARLVREVDLDPLPDVILVQSGSNNLLFGNLHFTAIFESMMPLLHSLCPTTPLVLCSLMPMPAASAADISTVNARLEEIAALTGNCTYLDLVQPFNEHCLPITQPGFLNDQVHLSTRGYQVWAGEINSCLKALQTTSSGS